jgi:hypothetical protein
VRQFSTLGEDWPLDYVPIVTGDEMPTSVLAATLSPETVKQIRATCEMSGLVPRRMVLRPMAAASLLSRQLPDAQRRCRMMIDLLSDEADLTVLVGERVVFLRTCRLPGYGDPNATNAALIGEIRRTMVAAQNQLGGRRVEYMIVCGNPTDHANLVERLGRELSLPVESFDPFAALPIADELRRRLPDRHGRFAPLLGMLVDEAAGTPHAIDFLNPRRRPPPPDRRRRNMIALGAAAAVLLAVGVGIYLPFHAIGAEIAAAQKELNQLVKNAPSANKKAQEATEVERFVHGDITWLDELHRLTDEEKFPIANDAIVESVVATARDNAGGSLLLEGHVREPNVINRMETSLRDERHNVVGKGGQSDPRGASYGWKFSETEMITHPEVDPPKPAKPKAPAAAAPARGAAPGGKKGGAK